MKKSDVIGVVIKISQVMALAAICLILYQM